MSKLDVAFRIAAGALGIANFVFGVRGLVEIDETKAVLGNAYSASNEAVRSIGGILGGIGMCMAALTNE